MTLNSPVFNHATGTRVRMGSAGPNFAQANQKGSEVESLNSKLLTCRVKIIKMQRSIFFSYFSQKIRLGISVKFSTWQTFPRDLMALIQGRIHVDAASLRCTDIHATLSKHSVGFE